MKSKALKENNDLVLKLNNEMFKKIFLFDFKRIIRNKIFIIGLVLFVLIIPIFIMSISLAKLNIHEYSLFLFVIPFSLMIILDIFLVNKLFSEAKHNSINLSILSKPIKKSNIFVERMMVIFSILIIGLFIQFLTSSIFIASFGMNPNLILYMFVSNLIIMPILNISVSSLLILLSTILKPLWFGITSLFGLLLLGFSPILTRSISPNEQQQLLTYNKDNANSFSKIGLVSKEGEYLEYIVDEININANFDGNIIDRLNNSNVYNYFVPGEAFATLNASLYNSLINIGNLEKFDSQFSLIKKDFINSNYANLIDWDQIAIATRVNDLMPLNLDSIEYENLIIKNIEKIANLNDPLILSQIKNKLSNNDIWNETSITGNEYEIISNLLGINLEFSQMFYLHSNFGVLKNKIPNLKNKIQTQFSIELWNLLEFLWTSENTFLNVFTYKTFGDTTINYPDIKVQLESVKPVMQDINFIKTKLITFNGNAIQYLDNNKQYQQTSLVEIKKIDPTIVDEKSWITFVENNTTSLKESKTLINKVNTILPNSFILNFENNSIDISKFSYFLMENQTTYLNDSQLLILAIILITALSLSFSFYKFNRWNYKNIE